jgi:mandelate racemase
MRVTEAAQWLEWQDWANPILAESSELKEGNPIAPALPGSGIEWTKRPSTDSTHRRTLYRPLL